MTFDHYVLLWLVGLPVLAAIVVALLGAQRPTLVRWISLLTSIATMVLSLILVARFMQLERSHVHTSASNPSQITFTPEFVPGSTPDHPHTTTWTLLNLGPGKVQFFLGVDGLNIWMVVLTAMLMLPSVLVSWESINERVNEFYAWLLVLQTAMMGIFLAFDIILFYMFFEVSLVPLYFLIGIWGGSQRQLAARKFFLFTLTGSLLTLLGVLGIVQVCHERTRELTFSIPRLVDLVHIELGKLAEMAKLGVDSPQYQNLKQYWNRVQGVVFTLLTIGFAVKVPLVPLHTWLPLAHVEAPTAGSVDLAGILLKVGVYGFLRLCIPLAPDISLSVGLPLLSILAAIGVVYGAFCAYGQQDIKRLIAYSSVSHLGLAMLGLYSLNLSGLTGAIMQMINHGLSSAALFLLVGIVYERYHTRQISEYSGMASKMPYFALFLVFMCMSSAGLPGLNGFVGEVLCLIGVIQHDRPWPAFNIALAAVGCTGIVLGAWYLITMMRRFLFGPLKEPEHEGHEIGDLKPREWLLMVPPTVFCVLLGVYPQPVIQAALPDVKTVVRIADRAREREREHARVAQTTTQAPDDKKRAENLPEE